MKMSAMMKKAPDSTDADDIKKAWDTEKSRVTRNVNRILKILRVDESGNYDHDSISEIELGQSEVSLREAFKNVEDLHSHMFSLSYDAAWDKEIEDEHIAWHNDLILAVEKKFYEGLRSIRKYELACEIGERESLKNVAKKSFEEAKESFEIAKKVALSVLDSEEIHVLRTASNVKEEFVKKFRILLASNEDFMKSLEKINPGDSRNNEKTDLTKEKKAASELNLKLYKLIQKNQFKETQSKINYLSSQIENSTKNQSKSHDDKEKEIEDEKEANDKKVEDSARLLQHAQIMDVIENPIKKLDSAEIAVAAVVESSDQNVRSTAGPMEEKLIKSFSDYEYPVEFKPMSLKDEKKYNLKCEEDRSLPMSLNEKDVNTMISLVRLFLLGENHTSQD